MKMIFLKRRRTILSKSMKVDCARVAPCAICIKHRYLTYVLLNISKEVHRAKNKKMTCYIEHIDFYLHYRSFCRSKRKLTVTNETVNTMHRPQTEYVKIIAPDMKANRKKNTLLSNKIQSRHEKP